MAQHAVGIFCTISLFFMISLLLPRQVDSSCLRAESLLYQPGPGAIMALGVSNDFITLNTASLSYVNTGHPVHNHVYFKSYLVSNQTGKHEIFGTCATAFAFTISLLDGQSEKSSTVKSPILTVTLRSGFRYKLKADFPACASCRIGVKLPNGNISDPVGSPYIYRSFGLYQRNLFLEQRYDKESIQRVEGPGKFFNGSALNFTTKPLRYTFKPSIEGSDDNAFIYSGVMSVSTGNFSFEISCTAKCRFTFTKSVSGRAQDVITPIETTYSTAIQLLNGDYCINFRFSNGGTVKVYQHFHDGTTRIASFTKHLLYPNSDDMQHRIAQPSLQVINASQIAIILSSTTYMYQKDGWTSDKKYEIACYEDGKSTLLQQFNFEGGLPKAAALTGLKNYTYYKCYTRHFGRLYNGVKYHVVSGRGRARTSENVPSAEPKNFWGSSKVWEINVEWDAIPAAFWQGQLNGYNIYHRIMHGLGPWKKSSTTQLSHTLKGKLLNEFYEFQVCGKTNAGEGLCSNVIAFRPQIPTNQLKEMSSISYHTELYFAHKKLIGHVQETQQVTSVDACFKKCLDCHWSKGGACTCASFNMQHLIVRGTGACEINAISAEKTPQQLVTIEGYQHYEVLHPEK